MTSTMIKDLSKSALLKPVFLILLVIALLLAPASALAEGDENPASDSNSTPTDFDQDLSVNSSSSGADFSVDIPSVNPDSTGINDAPALETPAPPPPDAPSAPAESFESSVDYEQDTTADFSGDAAGVDPGANDPDTNTSGTDGADSSDASASEQELAPPEAAVKTSTDVDEPGETEIPTAETQTTETETPVTTTPTDGNDPLATESQNGETESPTGASQNNEAEATKTYFQVAEVSMSPLLNPGAIIEIVSETYADGDMVVAQTSDGKYVVKMLDGDQLVPLGAGVSYSAADVTILGAASLSSMTAESLEQSGLTWHPVHAQTAEKPAGSGTSEDPFLIASLENLFWITAPDDVVTEFTQAQRWYNNKNYLQTANIDASFTSTWYSGAGWLPIGTNGSKFRANYNGQGFTINDLYINRPSENYIGLFGDIGSSPVIQNIELLNVNITGKDYVGGLSGKNFKGEIINCSVTGSITGEEAVGGLVGENDESGKISNSKTTGSVTGNNTVGGLAGINQGTIYNSNSSATLNGVLSLGGLVGKNTGGTIINSYATGTVSGEGEVGGLVGNNTNGTITNSYATGTVSGIEEVGGLVGENYEGTISNSYAAGSVTGTGTYVGGLVGYNEPGTISNSFYDRDTTGQSDIDKGEPKTTNEMKTLTTYTSWDIAGFDGSYPVLGWQVGESTIWYMEGNQGGGGGFGGFSGIGGFFNLGFTVVLPIHTVADLTPITGRVNVLITSGMITVGSWSDLYQASAAYQAALLFIENNGGTLNPAERALLEVELAIVKAALLAMEAQLLAAEGLPYNLAALQTAYAEAMATFNANQSFLNGDQQAAANQLLAAIAGVIAAL